MEEKRDKIKEWIKTDIILISVFTVYYLLMYFLNATCLIKLITGFECPACGMTRAMISLFTGNFKGYVDYNYMALPTLVAVYLLLHIKNKKAKIFINIYAIIVSILVLVRYLIKIL